MLENTRYVNIYQEVDPIILASDQEVSIKETISFIQKWLFLSFLSHHVFKTTFLYQGLGSCSDSSLFQLMHFDEFFSHSPETDPCFSDFWIQVECFFRFLDPDSCFFPLLVLFFAPWIQNRGFPLPGSGYVVFLSLDPDLCFFPLSGSISIYFRSLDLYFLHSLDPDPYFPLRWSRSSLDQDEMRSYTIKKTKKKFKKLKPIFIVKMLFCHRMLHSW